MSFWLYYTHGRSCSVHFRTFRSLQRSYWTSSLGSKLSRDVAVCVPLFVVTHVEHVTCTTAYPLKERYMTVDMPCRGWHIRGCRGVYEHGTFRQLHNQEECGYKRPEVERSKVSSAPMLYKNSVGFLFLLFNLDAERRHSSLPARARCNQPTYCWSVLRQEIGMARKSVSSRTSSKPSPESPVFRPCASFHLNEHFHSIKTRQRREESQSFNRVEHANLLNQVRYNRKHLRRIGSR